MQIVVEDNGGRAVFVDVVKEPTSLRRRLSGGPRSLAARCGGGRLLEITADVQALARVLSQGTFPGVAAWTPHDEDALDAIHARERREAILAARQRALQVSQTLIEPLTSPWPSVSAFTSSGC